MAWIHYFSSEYLPYGHDVKDDDEDDDDDYDDNDDDDDIDIASILGFVYGRDGNKLPSVTQTIKHYKQNQIFKMWLPKPNIEVLDALFNSQLEVTIGIPNADLRSLAINPAIAYSWVKKHIIDYLPGINFKYICVGNEALLTTHSDHLLPAMRNINDAIQAELTDMDMIKVSTTAGINDLDSYDPTSPPSTCSFNENVIENLVPILEFLDSNNTPLFVNIFPHTLRVNNPQEPALSHYLFTSTDPLVTDGEYNYFYVFECILDGFYSAMEELNMYNVNIVVAATGWPRGGGRDASVENAKKYNWNLLQHIPLGTPKRPEPLETYIYSMYDENHKHGSAWHKNYGVFDKDGKPFYPFRQ
ncbi:glucan endo-1,3-beta-glucosidase-like [Tasmannia lanceolata]|uniref:glucan endo-1,3-beta-glucosidase-like n=1 Tax=Tasmannia lanceolata TaxID=3420 RepID=UPI004063D6B7